MPTPSVQHRPALQLRGHALGLRRCAARRQPRLRCYRGARAAADLRPGETPAEAYERRQRESEAHFVPPLRPGETREEALLRRLRESGRVEERLVAVDTVDEFEAELKKAGHKLVVLEVHSDTVCQTGFEEEAELHWKADQQAALEPCRTLKHTFQRTARDCPDVVFLEHLVDDEDEEQALCEHLGVDCLPTVQFWRDGALLWEHRGVSAMEQELGQGVLFYGDTAGGGVKASTFVTEIDTRAEFEQFISEQPEQVLTVVDVSLTSASPCVHVFPAVLALAKNFQGYASFARVLGDASPELQQLMADYNIIQVPTFLFFRGGRETGRHVGSSRGDLIGQILAQQAAMGIAPPPPPGAAATPLPKARKAGAGAGPKRKRNPWAAMG